MPLETRSSEAICRRPSDVTGSTEMPSVVDQKRILVGAVGRAAILDHAQPPRWKSGRFTRWSSTMTQSETYSSRPWRVSSPSPRSPVMMAVTPLSFSQRNRRRSSARRMKRIGQPGEQRLDGIQHDAFGADGIDGVPEADEQTLPDRIRRPLRSRCARCTQNPARAFCARSGLSGRNRARRRSGSGPRRSPRRP